MPAHHLLVQRHRPQPRARLQQRHDLLLEDPPSGSGRLRPRPFLFSDGRPGSASIRYAVAVLNPAFAPASAGRSFFRCVI